MNTPPPMLDVNPMLRLISEKKRERERQRQRERERERDRDRDRERENGAEKSSVDCGKPRMRYSLWGAARHGGPSETELLAAGISGMPERAHSCGVASS